MGFTSSEENRADYGVLRPKKTSTLPEDAAARRLVDALVKNGVTTFFGVPGGPICPFFEAVRLDSRAKMVESRQETLAAFSAVAFARASGQVPAVVVTAGPGVTNAVTGIASAHLERVPMLVIAGDVAWSNHGGRLAQDSGPEGIDIERLLAPITRAQVRVARARSAVAQGLASLRAATDPNRPGPALLVLPIDEGMRSAPEVELDMSEPVLSLPVSLEAVAQTARWLCEAERPLLVVGGGCHGHAPAVARLVDALQVPFVTTPRAKGIVSERHPCSLRNGGMAASMWARRYTALGVDVALVLGTDL
ncbi:MAG TPA: thiamine pyrophosphate-binding protein, partial [bacterium]|nr:thiamine pyrophosphate-binding protein [bacterium]